METAVGRRHGPGKRVILTVGTDCAIGKMSVALELRRAAARGRAVRASFVPTGQTGMMIEGWGVAVDRLISDFAQGTVEWLVEQGEAPRRLGDRRGPGLARPPGLLVGDARPDPRRDAAGDGPRPQARPDRARLRPPARGVVPDRRRCRPFIELHERVAGLVAPSKVVAIALNTSLIADDDEARRVIAGDRGRDRACRPTTRSGSGRTALWAAIRERRRRLPWAAGLVSLHATRSCHLAPARPVPDRPLATTTPGTRSRRSSSSSATTGTRARRDRGGLPGPLLRRDAGDDGGGLAAAPRRGRRARADRGRARRRATGAMDARDPRPRRARSARIDIALHDLAGKVARPAGPRRCSACRPTSRRPTSRSASTSPRSSPSGRAAPPTSRRSRSRSAARPTSRRSRRSAPSSAARSGSTPTPAGRRDDAVALLPELVDLGVELIEQPFPARAPRDLGWLQERSVAADRRRRERGHHRGPRGARRRRRRGQREAREVRRHRAGRADARAGARARLPDVPRLHGGDVGRDRRSAVVASLADWVDLDGCLLLADDPFEGLELDDDKRWRLADGPGLGLSPRERRLNRSQRTFTHGRSPNARSCG